MQECWKISFTTRHVEPAEAALEAYGASAWSTLKAADGTAFEVYLPQPPEMDRLTLPPDAHPMVMHMPPHDWVSESQQNLPPVRIAPFYLHGSHDKPMSGGWRNIEMQAGLAFGSGHHGTTQGCLQAFATVLKGRKPPTRIADIGCGSGTLAIAAAKAGARQVWASDVDADAVAVTRRNAQLNQVSPQMTVLTAAGLAHPAYYGQQFDVIFANILAKPLLTLASTFERHLAANGTLIISGLLNEQARSVKARYRACGLKPTQQIIIGQWTSLALMR